MAARSPRREAAMMPENITRNYYLWRKSLEPAFSQTKLAAEIGISIRTAERWLAGGTPKLAVAEIKRRIRSTERRHQAKMPR